MAVKIGAPVAPRSHRIASLARGALVPLLAILTALLIGAVIIWFSAPENRGSRLSIVLNAYRGLFAGAFGGRQPIANTLVEATPYMLAGLAVALAFKCGLFNIGAEGQLYIGALASVTAGFAITGLPAIVHLPLALAAGALAGGLWAAIPGYLRARTGAHEVITTIMLNYIAFRLMDYLIVSGPLRDPRASLSRTPYIQASAQLPRLIGPVENPALTGGQQYTPLIVSADPGWNLRLHLGFVLALLAVWLIWWLLNRTTLGFEIRTVGANPEAARYAGISITKNFVLAMALSGALAGLAGSGQVLGLERNMKALFSSGYGFDSIAIALLAKSNPVAIVPAAIFWGALNTGRGQMQALTGISSDLIRIVQALVVIFIAAPQIVRFLYRIRAEDQGQVIFSRGWG
ncbi:ABC transporter permease [Kallotenue papyrolyticum]|uniref:ABC transporter permease n=1 Tax=Kallotenue papyrolyticum TaxID=1325125 RepID=UPI00047863C5|nr:ABC transporter permease [Kallotenue papyrolyticum]